MEKAVSRLLTQILHDDGSLKAKLTVILGAGASKEFGFPTSREFAKKYFLSDLSDNPIKNDLNSSESPPDNLIDKFINEYTEELSNDIAYSFFKNVEREFIGKIKSGDVLLHDRLLNLWKEGFIKVVVTTNFDNVLELRLQENKIKGELSDVNLVVWDYNDINRNNRPNAPEGYIFAKLAGDISRSNMLWSRKDFREYITSSVQSWLSDTISDTPILMLGYTASETPLNNVFSKHKRYSVSVAPEHIESIPTLNGLREKREQTLEHAVTTANKFIELLYDKIYQKTLNTELKLSFNYISDCVSKLMTDITENIVIHDLVERNPIKKEIEEYAYGATFEGKLLILLGESGCGKSTLLTQILKQSDEQITLLIPASEVINGVESWAQKLGVSGLSDIVMIVRTIKCKLTIIVDGLNEEGISGQAQCILNELITILDQDNNDSIRVVISCRTDVWHNLGLSVKRNYVLTKNLDSFNNTEVSDAKKIISSYSLKLLEKAGLLDLLNLPENLGYILELESCNIQINSEPDLLRHMLKSRLDRLSGDGVLIWFSNEIRKQQSTSIHLEIMDISDRKAKALHLAKDAGLLSLNRSSVARFSDDRLGEFYYGAMYLYNYLWVTEKEERSGTIRDFFSKLVDEFNSIPVKYSPYRILFINSLRAFLCSCTDEEISEVYDIESNLIRNLVRSAVVSKRYLRYEEKFSVDPALMAVCLLSQRNHLEICQLITKTDNRFVSSLPFAFSAKLFPLSLAEFICFMSTYAIEEECTKKSRYLLSSISASVLVLVLKQGPTAVINNSNLVDSLIKIVEKYPQDYILGKIEECLNDNSKLLFHWHPTAKLTDIFSLPERLKKLLIAALEGSIFSIPVTDLTDIIDFSSSSRLLCRLLIIREIDSNMCAPMMDKLFRTGNIKNQDFVMGILGVASKIDESYEEKSESYVIEMRDSYPNNFYGTNLDDITPVVSQYDPLVPHATTILERHGSLPIDRLLPEVSNNSNFRLGRLSQKTSIDFPEETLIYLSSFLTTNADVDSEIIKALKIVVHFFPSIFWKFSKTMNPELLSSITDDSIEDINILVAQVRDYDWVKTYRYLINEEESQELITKIVKYLLTNDSLDIPLRHALNFLTSYKKRISEF